MTCKAHAPPATEEQHDSIRWGDAWSARRIRLHDSAWILDLLNKPLVVDGLVQLAAIRLTSGGEWLPFEAGRFGFRGLDGFDVRFGWGPVGCLGAGRVDPRASVDTP